MKRKHSLSIALSLFSAAVLGTAGTAQGQSLFGPAVNYAVPGPPSSIAVGDFNGDGVPDLAIANIALGSIGQISILLGNPDGTFQAPSNITLAAFPFPVATGDFNGDGKLDLAVGTGDLTILLGNGDGTFQPETDFSLGSGFDPFSMVVADFNRDGKLDVALANSQGGAQNAGNVTVLLGNGDGTFQPATNYSAGTGPFSIAAGDFNGDGALDLAIANFRSNTVSVLVGNGAGAFAAPVSYNAGLFPESVVAADLDGDGKLDLVVGRGNSTKVGVLFGNGDGTFQVPAAYDAGGTSAAVAVRDANGDGVPDIVVANGSVAGTVAVLLGLGNRRFQSPLTFTVGSEPFSLTTADFNGDGRLDVVAGNLFSDTVSVLLNAGALPAVTLSPTSLSFGAQLVGTTSAAQKVTLTNSGIAPLDISSFTVSGDFVQSNTCGGTVGLGASCTIYVSFQPKARGTRTGSLSIVDNSADSPQVITLTGTGCVVKLAPSSLDFGSVPVGTSSQAQTVTVTNLGKATLTITSIAKEGTDPGDFTETGNCGSSLAAGASCSINVTFTPQATGSRSALLVVFDNGGGTDQVATLTGTGT